MSKIVLEERKNKFIQVTADVTGRTQSLTISALRYAKNGDKVDLSGLYKIFSFDAEVSIGSYSDPQLFRGQRILLADTCKTIA
jgi:hypothetical protein